MKRLKFTSIVGNEIVANLEFANGCRISVGLDHTKLPNGYSLVEIMSLASNDPHYKNLTYDEVQNLMIEIERKNFDDKCMIG